MIQQHFHWLSLSSTRSSSSFSKTLLQCFFFWLFPQLDSANEKLFQCYDITTHCVLWVLWDVVFWWIRVLQNFDAFNAPVCVYVDPSQINTVGARWNDKIKWKGNVKMMQLFFSSWTVILLLLVKLIFSMLKNPWIVNVCVCVFNVKWMVVLMIDRFCRVFWIHEMKLTAPLFYFVELKLSTIRK